MVQSIAAMIAPSPPVLLALAPKTWREIALLRVSSSGSISRCARSSYASVLVRRE
jgi:hypothetical protein